MQTRILESKAQQEEIETNEKKETIYASCVEVEPASKNTNERNFLKM